MFWGARWFVGVRENPGQPDAENWTAYQSEWQAKSAIKEIVEAGGNPESIVVVVGDVESVEIEVEQTIVVKAIRSAAWQGGG